MKKRGTAPGATARGGRGHEPPASIVNTNRGNVAGSLIPSSWLAQSLLRKSTGKLFSWNARNTDGGTRRRSGNGCGFSANGPAVPEGQPVHRAPEQLYPHPVYLDVCGPTATEETPHDLAESTPVIVPLLTTQDGLILDGHTRWQLAVRQRQPSVACIEYDLTDEQALLFMLDQHRHAERLNAFGRIVMAPQLEPHWRAQARERQRQGGTEKLSSTLTKADAIDVRAEIARAAGVGTGNVTKVKQLLETATPAVRDALRRGEISIHRAWQWRGLGPSQQNKQLDQYRYRKDINHTIGHLLRKHRDEQDKVLTIEQFAAQLVDPDWGGLAHATLHVVDLPGPTIIVTRDLRQLARGTGRVTRPALPPLKRILALGRPDWDRPETRPAVREASRKVLDCGTAALGAEVFASAHTTRVVYHTCKSRACPSCGYRATTLWQRAQWRELPDIPYNHVTFTMPDVLWPIFRHNRQLLHDLPVLGAKVIEQWAHRTYGVRLMMMVIPHTFGRHLNFNCHLHVLVSEGGLEDDGSGWRKRAPLNRKALMRMWRYAVITYLREAYRMGVLKTDLTARQLAELLRRQYERE